MGKVATWWQAVFSLITFKIDVPFPIILVQGKSNQEAIPWNR